MPQNYKKWQKINKKVTKFHTKKIHFPSSGQQIHKKRKKEQEKKKRGRKRNKKVNKMFKKVTINCQKNPPKKQKRNKDSEDWEEGG